MNAVTLTLSQKMELLQRLEGLVKMVHTQKDIIRGTLESPSLAGDELLTDSLDLLSDYLALITGYLDITILGKLNAPDKS